MALLGSQEELDRIRHNAIKRRYKKNHRDKVRAQKRKDYRRKTGFTDEEIEQHKKDRMAYARSFRQKTTQV